MKKWVVAAAASVIGLGALAAERTPAAAQQQLVAACGTDADARLMKGHDKTAFVSTCVTEGRKREKQAAKACNEAAAYKQAHERRKFIEECLKH